MRLFFILLLMHPGIMMFADGVKGNWEIIVVSGGVETKGTATFNDDGTFIFQWEAGRIPAEAKGSYDYNRVTETLKLIWEDGVTDIYLVAGRWTDQVRFKKKVDGIIIEDFLYLKGEQADEFNGKY